MRGLLSAELLIMLTVMKIIKYKDFTLTPSEINDPIINSNG